MTRSNTINSDALASAGRITAGGCASVDAFNDLFLSIDWAGGAAISDRHGRFAKIPVKLNRSGRAHGASLRSAARRAVEAYNAAP